ncbi:MAG: tRNA pseudouridine(55) synthase TruB [bacterium]
MEGFLLINKPAGITSHDVVNQVRKLSGEQKVGHSGTLDPFATGLLIVGIGRTATKHLGDLTDKTEKTYLATLQLGATSDTDDRDGIITEQEDVKQPSKYEVVKVVKSFIGQQSQVPPVYSSIKIGGTRAHRLARQGQPVNLGRRIVDVYEIHVRNYSWPDLTIEVVCSTGTYIRAIGRDIGEKLGVGAYLESLIRTRIGKWTVEQASDLSDGRNLLKKIVPVEELMS